MTERVKPKWSSNGHLHKHKSHSTIFMKKKKRKPIQLDHAHVLQKDDMCSKLQARAGNVAQ